MRVLHLSRSLLVTQSDMAHEVCVGFGEPPERHLPSNFQQNNTGHNRQRLFWPAGGGLTPQTLGLKFLGSIEAKYFAL